MGRILDAHPVVGPMLARAAEESKPVSSDPFVLLRNGGPVGIVLAAILFAALHAGGSVMQSDAGISSNLVLVVQALILFSIAANFLGAIKLRLPRLGRAAPPPPASAQPSSDPEQSEDSL